MIIQLKLIFFSGIFTLFAIFQEKLKFTRNYSIIPVIGGLLEVPQGRFWSPAPALGVVEGSDLLLEWYPVHSTEELPQFLQVHYIGSGKSCRWLRICFREKINEVNAYMSRKIFMEQACAQD